jgi:hypothetical protein
MAAFDDAPASLLVEERARIGESGMVPGRRQPQHPRR